MPRIRMHARHKEYRFYALIAWLYLAVTWTLDAVHSGNGWDIAASVVAIVSFLDLVRWALQDRRDRVHWRHEFAKAAKDYRNGTVLMQPPGGNTSKGGPTD